MIKTFVVFVIGGILGVIAGAGGMLIAFPFIFPPAPANETIDGIGYELITDTYLREDSAGQDAGHWGRGDVSIYRKSDGNYAIQLAANFEVGPGPNFWIYVNAVGDIEDEDDFNADSARVKIAKLRSFSGSQVYEIEAAVLEGGAAVTIWCESFGQYIASADYTI